MTNIPNILYTICFKREFDQTSDTFGSTGVFKQIYFSQDQIKKFKNLLNQEQIIVAVPIESFIGGRITFNEIGEQIWENYSVVLKKYIKQFHE